MSYRVGTVPTMILLEDNSDCEYVTLVETGDLENLQTVAFSAQTELIVASLLHNLHLGLLENNQDYTHLNEKEEHTSHTFTYK